MKEIKVLGTGCATCHATVEMIETEAAAAGIEIRLEKVEEIAEIMSYGVMSTPGVMVDGEVVHAGGMPAKAEVRKWLQS